MFLREQHTATPPSSPTHEPTKSFQAYICINKETRSQESLPTSISLLLPKEIQLFSLFLFIQKKTITTTTRVLGMACQLLFFNSYILSGLRNTKKEVLPHALPTLDPNLVDGESFGNTTELSWWRGSGKKIGPKSHQCKPLLYGPDNYRRRFKLMICKVGTCAMLPCI